MRESGPVDGTPPTDEPARLRLLVRFDIFCALIGEVVVLATYAFVERSRWLLVLGAIVAGTGVVMSLGLRPLRRGDLEGAVRWLAAANWSAAWAVTLIATFAWPVLVVAAVLPAVLAAPYVPQRRLRVYLVVSFAVAVAVAATGLLQDVTGFEDQLPTWMPPAVAIFFTPVMAGLVIQTALQHSTRLHAVLAETLSVNRQLRRSEEALAEQARSLHESRARVVAATDRERRRVERDLHDGAQQRLVALRVRLRMAEELCRTAPTLAAESVAAIREEVQHIQNELRNLAHGVYPTVLTQHGLTAALGAAADRCPIPVEVCADRIGRFAPDAEAAVYFCCVEALQNAAKHAGPMARVRVTLEADDGTVRFTVRDDGAGFDPSRRPHGSGLDNLRDRVAVAGGTLNVESQPGRGTVVVGTVPITTAAVS